MKKLIAAFLLSVVPVVASAAGGGAHLDAADVDLRDQASLQRGAKLFADYCMGCHGLKYARYQRVGNDIGMTEDEVKRDLMVSGGKIGDLMKSAMSPADSEKYFGTVVPDLTLVARLRGEDWVYTYLRSFYVDEKRPLGVNNSTTWSSRTLACRTSSPACRACRRRSSRKRRTTRATSTRCSRSSSRSAPASSPRKSTTRRCGI